jgi:hypothetical protein
MRRPYEGRRHRLSRGLVPVQDIVNAHGMCVKEKIAGRGPVSCYGTRGKAKVRKKLALGGATELLVVCP